LAHLEAFHERSASFESVAFYATDEGVLSNDLGSQLVDFATVSGSFFSTLRGDLKLGRALGPADDLTPAVVISEGLWRRLFGGSANAVGQQVTLASRRGDNSQRATWRRTSFTIVGVAQRSLQFPTPQTDVWTTAGFVRTLNPRCCSFLPVARLQSNATFNQATRDATVVAQTLAAANPTAYSGLRARVVGLHEQLVLTVQPSLGLLMTAVGLMLFVACANVTNLLLARNVARARERAVRLALGASRGRLVVASVVESGNAAAQPLFRTLLLCALAALALSLATVGLYGVVSYSVSQRTAEIGIRMALGATTNDVATMIVSEGVRLALGGVVIGVAGAYALSRTLTSFLYGVAPTDVASFAFASGFLFLFAVIASYVPARKATRIDLAIALRAE
jgi:ABC-type antimicrobial peptide transport system permease subunit